MIQYTDIVKDERSQSPIEGAEVYVYNVAENDDDTPSLATLYANDGTTEIGNPLTTNNLGVYSFYHPATELIGDVYVGARLRYRSRLFVGGGYAGAAQAAAAAAQNAVGIESYPNTAAGLAGTTLGETFWIDNANGTGTTYRHDAGPVATEVGKFLIDPTASTAAGLIGITGGGQVQDHIDAITATTGSNVVPFLNTGTGATARKIQPVLRDLPLNPKDYGAIGDAFFHPLSERFATLGAAQAVYPFVTSLTQSIDGVAIQAALNEAARDVNRRGVVRLPVGYYPLSDSLELPNFVTFEGESRHGCVLFNQIVALAVPMMVNKAPESLIYATVRRISFFGGTHGIKLNVDDGLGGGEIAALTIEDVSFILQTTRCFEANRQVQTSRFINVGFDANNVATNCFRSNAGANNANVFIGCDFLNSVDAHLYINAGSGNQFIGCRFEGGGGTSFDGKRTLQFNAMAAASFYGCYFETTHEYLMEQTNSDGTMLFAGCDFIGPQDSGDFRAYKWISDKEVTFLNNSFYRTTTGPAYTINVGANPGLIAPIPAIASAATITLPSVGAVFSVTGTTGITSVTATTTDTGRSVRLVFAGILTMTDGSNLKLAGNLVTAANTTISLICNGTDWIETGRSVN